MEHVICAEHASNIPPVEYKLHDAHGHRGQSRTAHIIHATDKSVRLLRSDPLSCPWRVEFVLFAHVKQFKHVTQTVVVAVHEQRVKPCIRDTMFTHI